MISLHTAIDLAGLSGALNVAQHELAGLWPHRAWQGRMNSAFETIVDTSIERLRHLDVSPRDTGSLGHVYRTLKDLAPQALAARHQRLLCAVQQLGARALRQAETDTLKLDGVFSAFETLLPMLPKNAAPNDSPPLGESLVTELWHGLRQAPQPLAIGCVAMWTQRSWALCGRHPAPQLAAVVWLRALVCLPQLTVAQCIEYVGQLQAIWAEPKVAGGAAGHSPCEPAPDEAALAIEARVQLGAWLVALTVQLSELAPSDVAPIRAAFLRLLEALHARTDIELCLPGAQCDADMQTLDAFVDRWQREAGRDSHDDGAPFFGHEQLATQGASLCGLRDGRGVFAAAADPFGAPPWSPAVHSSHRPHNALCAPQNPPSRCNSAAPFGGHLAATKRAAGVGNGP